MKTELQAQRDYTEISELLQTLCQRINLLQYDMCEIEIIGSRMSAKLIETPGYKTIVHRFTRSGKYERKVETW